MTHQELVYILYDGRAEFLDTDDCAVYVACGSKAEARSFLKDFPDGVCFRYRVVDGTLLDEERVELGEVSR